MLLIFVTIVSVVLSLYIELEKLECKIVSENCNKTHETKKKTCYILYGPNICAARADFVLLYELRCKFAL